LAATRSSIRVDVDHARIDEEDAARQFVDADQGFDLILGQRGQGRLPERAVGGGGGDNRAVEITALIGNGHRRARCERSDARNLPAAEEQVAQTAAAAQEFAPIAERQFVNAVDPENVRGVEIGARDFEFWTSVIEKRLDQLLRSAHRVGQVLLEGVVALQVQAFREPAAELHLQRVVAEETAVGQQHRLTGGRVGQEFEALRQRRPALNVLERQVRGRAVTQIVDHRRIGQLALLTEKWKDSQLLAASQARIESCARRKLSIYLRQRHTSDQLPISFRIVEEQVVARAQKIRRKAVVDNVYLVVIDPTPEVVATSTDIANWVRVRAECALNAEVVFLPARRRQRGPDREGKPKVTNPPAVILRVSARHDDGWRSDTG